MKKIFVLIGLLVLSTNSVLKSQAKKATKNTTTSVNENKTKVLNLENLIRLKTTATFSGVSSNLLNKGFYFKRKNDIYSLFTNGKEDFYYFPGSENDGTGIVNGNASEIKEKIAVQYLFNSKIVYEKLLQESYNYLGARLYKSHTDNNGDYIKVIKTSDFVFIFGENVDRTDPLQYKLFITSISNFVE